MREPFMLLIGEPKRSIKKMSISQVKVERSQEEEDEIEFLKWVEDLKKGSEMEDEPKWSLESETWPLMDPDEEDGEIEYLGPKEVRTLAHKIRRVNKLLLPVLKLSVQMFRIKGSKIS